MTRVWKPLLGAMVALVAALPGSATDFSDGNIHKNDYKWVQFNLMDSEKARIPFGSQEDQYLEMEFGARSGIFDFYGYVDWFDIFNRKGDDRHAMGSAANGTEVDQDNMFTKLAPRISLDALFQRDLSFGPVKELYIANEMDIGDRRLWEQYIGIGSDVMVPWLGKVGVNLMKRYVRENYGADNEGRWDGYQLATNYFKPFIHFDNKTFIAYQGYLDYKFKATNLRNDPNDNGLHATHSVEWFNGFYWHSDRYALGYGLKVFNNMALVQDGGPTYNAAKPKQDTTGIGHYFSATYKW